MLNAAYAAGIRYVDAARSYGMAEAFLGTWLRDRNLPNDAITIGSKWGYSYVGAWRLDAPVHEVKDLSVDTLRRQIAESLIWPRRSSSCRPDHSRNTFAHYHITV